MFDSYLIISPCLGRTKAEPPIYYMPAKPLIEDPTIVEQNKEKVYPKPRLSFVIVRAWIIVEN
jgi:pinin